MFLVGAPYPVAPFCVLIVQFLRCFMPDINLVHPLIQNALKQENGIAERVINKECALSEKEIELIRKENELRVKEEELRRRSLLGSTRSFILKSHTHRAFVLFALVAKNYSHEFFRFERHKNGQAEKSKCN